MHRLTLFVLDGIQKQRNWQKAIDVIASDRKSVYAQRCHNNERRIGIHPNLTHNSDLAIHELCRMATVPTSVRFSKDEISDDEEDDDGDENSNDTEVELDQIFDACELEEGTKMHEVTQFMINISHSMGPVRVPTPPTDNDDDDENDTTDTANNNLVDAIERASSDPSQTSNNDKASSNQFTLHKSILTYADSTGKTPLHILCESSCDSSMLQVILGSTREATGDPNAPTAFSLILAQDSRGSTPLHYMSYNRQCPFSSLKLMMDYCKPRFSSKESSSSSDAEQEWIDPTLCTDHDGETPLHWALAGYVSSRRIKELTRHSVDAILVENNKGEKPFDQFTSNFVDSDWTDHDVCANEVWENIQEYLNCIHDNQVHNHHQTTNSKNTTSASDVQTMNESDSSDSNESSSCVSEWCPLHFLAGSEYEFPSIFADLALKYCSQDLSKPDGNGMLPLHLACARTIRQSSNSSTNQQPPKKDRLALKILKKYHRASLVQARSTKRLPLHFAVDSQKPLSLITALIRTYPRSLNIPDPVTKLWPYVLAGVENNNDKSQSSSSSDPPNTTTTTSSSTNESLSVSFALLRADPSVLQLVRKNKFVNPRTDQEKLRSVDQNDEEDYMEHNSRRIRRLTIRDD